MDNICIFTLGRTSYENFIAWLNIEKWNFNSFDLEFNKKTEEEIIALKPTKNHVCKIYIETSTHPKVHTFFKNNINNYSFIHFHRKNLLKHYLTQKLQDNLIGKYGVDYKEFVFDNKDYINFTEKIIEQTNKFKEMYKECKFLEYDVEKALQCDHQGLEDIVGKKQGTFQGAFSLELCQKFVKNFDFSRIDNF